MSGAGARRRPSDAARISVGCDISAEKDGSMMLADAELTIVNTMMSPATYKAT